jgi:DNA-binding beta-propeller fold protein YncE
MAVVLLGIGLASAAAADSAAAAGGFSFVECLTGKRPVTVEPRTPREGGCKVSGGVALDGEGSGMNYVRGLAASPDGRSLYAVSSRDDAVSAFTARPLAFSECFSTNAHLRNHGAGPCQLLPHPGTEDVVSGFNGVHFVTVSPDGRSVYAVSNDGSIGIFARAGSSGRLTYKGCLTGDDGRFGSAHNGACRAIPSATDGGLFSGLGGPTTLAVSPDGRFVYVGLADESGIATLARSLDGSLTFLGCLQGRTSQVISGSGLTSPCPLVAPDANNPNGSGLVAPRQIVISADGGSLYASSPRRSAIAEFRRDIVTGALIYQGCIGAADRGTGPGDPCSYVPQANELGDGTGMYGIAELALSPSGRTVFGLSSYDQSLTTFARDQASGALSFVTGTEVTRPRGLAIGGDGRDLFVGSPGLAAIDHFTVTPANGGLSFAGCLTASPKATGPCTRVRAASGRPQRLGFRGFSSLAVAGNSLYASASGGSAISRFRIR